MDSTVYFLDMYRYFAEKDYLRPPKIDTIQFLRYLLWMLHMKPLFLLHWALEFGFLTLSSITGPLIPN